MTIKQQRAAKIAALNDALRRDPASGRHGRIMMTSGVNARGIGFTFVALDALTAFDAFTPDNDPYGEHDFGKLAVVGVDLYFKIDYFQRGSDLSAGAESPDDAATTDRVLTLMLTEEY